MSIVLYKIYIEILGIISRANVFDFSVGSMNLLGLKVLSHWRDAMMHQMEKIEPYKFQCYPGCMSRQCELLIKIYNALVFR